MSRPPFSSHKTYGPRRCRWALGRGQRLHLGRKNFLFVGTDEAGENLAGLYSLMAPCEVNGINPVAYLADVLLRVQTHQASRINELVPHNWKPPKPEPSA